LRGPVKSKRSSLLQDCSDASNFGLPKRGTLLEALPVGERGQKWCDLVQPGDGHDLGPDAIPESDDLSVGHAPLRHDLPLLLLSICMHGERGDASRIWTI